jgi:hypothetical protein
MNRTPSSLSFCRLPLASLAGTVTALLLAGPAQAQLRPYYVQVSETVTYDSNLFRSARDEDSDFISSTVLSGGFEERLGRQRVFGNAGVSGNVYQDNDQLNGVGYNLLLGLDWEVGSSLSGGASVRAAQNQASFGDYGTFSANRTGKNRERSVVLDFDAQYGRGILAFEVLGNHTDISYSDNGFSSRDRKSDTVGAGVRFRPGGPWTFGLTGRYTEGEYPDTIDQLTGATLSDDYERRDIDLTAQYQATGRSRLGARISHTVEEHDLVTARDFDGLTGGLNWFYQATGKTSVVVSLTRSTGTGSDASSLAVPSTDPLSPTPVASDDMSFLTDSRRTDSLDVSATWQATAKIGVNAGVSYSRERYDTRFVEGASVDSNSKGHTQAVSLSATYAITRAWSLACGVSHQSRDTDISTSAGSFGYDANVGYCSAALRLQ